MASAFDLIGVTTLLGADIALSSLRYVNINKYRLLNGFFVIPGLYKIATSLLKRNNSQFARILSPGKREENNEILGFVNQKIYKYIGLLSGTNCNLNNVCFESWLNKKRESNDSISKKKKRPESGTTTIVNFTILKKIQTDDLKININEIYYTFIGMILQILAIVILILIYNLNDTVCTYITLSNMVCHFLIIFVLRFESSTFKKVKPAFGVPKGNSIIFNRNNGDDLWAINGDETEIQTFLQNNIQTEKNKYIEFVEFIISVMSLIVSVITILFVPKMSHHAKLYFTIELFIGLLYIILYGSRDLDIFKKIVHKDNIKSNYNKNLVELPLVKTIKFTNRPSAIACILFFTNGDPSFIPNDIIPKDPLAYCDYRYIIGEFKKKSAELEQIINPDQNESANSLEQRQREMQLIDFLKTYINCTLINNFRNYNDCVVTWPDRIIFDIIEGFQESLFIKKN